MDFTFGIYFFIDNSVFIGEGKSPPLPLLGKGPEAFSLESYNMSKPIKSHISVYIRGKVSTKGGEGGKGGVEGSAD